MRIDLRGQVALLSGDGRPIDGAVARKLAEAEAQVVRGSPRAALAERGRLDMVVDCGPADADGEDAAGLLRQATETLEEAAAALGGQGGGRVVTVIGGGATVVRRGQGRRSAAMAGIASLTRTLAIEHAARSVRINAVVVGPGEDAASHIPLGRGPSLRSVANAVLFLLAPEASYVTGHVLVVDGGFSSGYVRNF